MILGSVVRLTDGMLHEIRTFRFLLTFLALSSPIVPVPIGVNLTMRSVESSVGWRPLTCRVFETDSHLFSLHKHFLSLPPIRPINAEG